MNDVINGLHMKIPLNIILIVLFALTGILTCIGCSQSVPQTKKFALSNPFHRDRPQRAAHITCFWLPKTLTETQGITRGFQGEVIFYRDDKMRESIMVDGNLTIYVFDAEDQNIVHTDGYEGIMPLCEYKFNRESLARGFAKNKKSKLISYGIWLPFDKMPGEEKNLVLRVRFDGAGKGGETLGTGQKEQYTVYLPGTPKQKQEQAPAAAGFNGIQQAAWNDPRNDAYDFSNIRQSAYSEAVQNLPSDTRISGDAIPMSPAMVRQLINAQQQERETQNTTTTTSTTTSSNSRSLGVSFGGGDTPTPTGNTTMQVPNAQAANTQSANQAPIGFGSGNSMPPEASPTFLARNRQNVSSIGSEIDQRMQNGQFAVTQAGYNNVNPLQQNNVQQASWAAQNQPNDTEATRRASIQQEMTRFMAEQEQRRQSLNRNVNAQGFTDYNANSFATDQNRITVPQSQNPWPQAPMGQQPDYFAPNRLPVQNSGTSLSAYAQSEWGPGLESSPSDRQTQVLYSPSSAGRIYR